MKAEYINPFLLSTKNVIETMSKVPIRAQGLQKKEHHKAFGAVTGIIGMVSNTIAGSMVISFSEPCILSIYAGMMMETEKTVIDSDVIDAVGELTNMICGGAKAELAKLDLKFNLATPTTLKGKNLEICYRQDAPIIVIPFMTPAGGFVVEANFAGK